jgi:Na+-driven multidrug efflux pump
MVAGSESSLAAELRALLRLSIPLGLTSAARIGQLLTDQSVLGHLTTAAGEPTALYLDAASLALLWMNLTNGSVVRGLGSAVGVLVAQALGAGARESAGGWLTLGLASTLLSSAAVAGLWLLTPLLLGAFVPDTQAVSLAGEYARLSIGWLLPTQWLEVLNAALTAQGVVLPQLLAYPTFLLINFGLNYLFVLRLGLGLPGSPLGTTATRVGLLLSVLLLTALLPRLGRCTHRQSAQQASAAGWQTSAAEPLHPREEEPPAEPLPAGTTEGSASTLLPPATRPPPEPSRLVYPISLRTATRPDRLRTFYRQVAPTLLSSLLEELQLEGVGLLAGRLGAEAMSTHASMLMTFFWLTAPMFGLVRAISVRVGLHLGAGAPREAKRAAALGYACCCSLALLVSAALVLLRRQLGTVFSSDANVVTMVSQIAPIVAAAYALVGLFYGSVATLNGQGRPLPVALAFLSGAFFISPAAGYVLSDRVRCCAGVPLRGVWLGLVAGYSVTSTLVLIAVCRSDWPALARAAIARSRPAAEVIPAARGEHGGLRNGERGEEGAGGPAELGSESRRGEGWVGHTGERTGPDEQGGTSDSNQKNGNQSGES